MSIIIILIVIFLTVFTYSLCTVSAKADRESTEIDSEIYRRKDR